MSSRFPPPPKHSLSTATSAPSSPINASPVTAPTPPTVKPNSVSTPNPAHPSNSAKAETRHRSRRSRSLRSVSPHLLPRTKPSAMPPAYMGRDKLSDKEIALIKTWIEQSAKYEPFWSFIPPIRPAVPPSDWARNPIDNFVYAKSRLPKVLEAISRSRQAHSHPPRLSRSHRHSSPSRRSRRLPLRLISQGLRESRRPSPRLTSLRRTHGLPLDGKRPLRRYQRLSNRRSPRNVALARLGHRRLQQKHAVRRVHCRPTHGDLLPHPTRDQNHRHRLQPQPPDQRRRRHHSGVVSLLWLSAFPLFL